jgi:Dyp-type peroxidase family
VRTELVIKGKSLTGTSDLTLLAPVIPGLVSSLESITYKTRVKRLLKTLQGGRVSLHEYAAYRPLSDAVERVAKIQSFRVVVLEPEDKVLLAVTFDGTWEAYIRVLWEKVGTLLDIIFCNTEGYVLSAGTFEAWAGWVRRVQVETAFYFNTHGLTVDDVRYLRTEESIHRALPGAPESDLNAVRAHVRSAEEIAGIAATITPAAQAECLRQGLQSLAVLFRMTDMYLPGTPDGAVLQRASRDLLVEFLRIAGNPALPDAIRQAMRKRFARQLDWLMPTDQPDVTDARPVPELAADSAPAYDRHDVQGGILGSFAGVSHGVLLLFAFDSCAAGAGLLQRLIPMVTTDAAAASLKPRDVAVTVALTYEGLRALGLSEQQLAWFAPEFREGMEARASMLGDFRTNHPRRWRLPTRHSGSPQLVELSAVHLVVQLRIAARESDPHELPRPLPERIDALALDPATGQPFDGLRLLAVQSMHRQLNAEKQIVEHFGFVDGSSDPVIDPAQTGTTYANLTHLGEFLLGYPNDADPAPQPASQADAERLAFLRNGSFLVVRKLRQDVPALLNAVRSAADQTHLDPELILAKMMGRWQDGRPLVAPETVNDFDYRDDANGSRCPFHAHIRRANPRSPFGGVLQSDPGRRRPRVLRRGMSYGPRYALPRPGPGERAEDDGAERGLVFMAYNASISEQFEVIQRWISGGNSAGGYSGQSDPFLGVPDIGETRRFRFEHADAVDHPTVHSIALDQAPALNEPALPFVRLEWGMYLFTPSMTALRWLNALAASGVQAPAVWSAERGEALIAKLLAAGAHQSEVDAVSAWKAVLEDPEAQEKFISADVWAAIREKHAGVLRTPYGVLVADRSLVMEVLGDPSGRFSVEGYRHRMQAADFEIYLGLDRSPDGSYEAQSADVNAAIGRLTEPDAFALAYDTTGAVLEDFIADERAMAAQAHKRSWELNLDVKEVCDKVLAKICQHWFGLPAGAGAPLVPGSWRWDWKEGDPAIYPTQFTAPSRYFFQPRPARDVQAYGCRYGQALTRGLQAFIAPHRANGSVPPAPDGTPPPLAQAILGAFDNTASDAFVARTFAGALMGFLPTVDGNLRLSLNEWLRDGTFWSLRAAWPQQVDAAGAHAAANQWLRPALDEVMHLRPSPELIWRTATLAHDHLGKVALRKGDVVVLSLVSATQQCLQEGHRDISPVFGGRRSPGHPHPTHACPGYAAGMGVLLGMLGAFMNVRVSMRPSPVPLAFTFEGET